MTLFQFVHDHVILSRIKFVNLNSQSFPKKELLVNFGYSDQSFLLSPSLIYVCQKYIEIYLKVQCSIQQAVHDVFLLPVFSNLIFGEISGTLCAGTEIENFNIYVASTIFLLFP